MKTFKINAFEVITRAIEEGVDAGWRRAYKYSEAPPENEVKEAMIESVINAITEVVIFDENSEA